MAKNNHFSGERSTTVTAANVKVIFNGSVVGFVTEASWSIDFGNKPIYTIDSIIPAEILPGPYRATFNLSGTRILKNSLEDAGLAYYPGVNLDSPYFTLAIIERESGNLLLNMKACTIDTIQNSIAAKSIASLNMTGTGFVALSSSGAGITPYDGTPQQLP